jgi:hypothetical protein
VEEYKDILGLILDTNNIFTKEIRGIDDETRASGFKRLLNDPYFKKFYQFIEAVRLRAVDNVLSIYADDSVSIAYFQIYAKFKELMDDFFKEMTLTKKEKQKLMGELSKPRPNDGVGHI